MTVDLDSRETTINYEGGSLTMTIGNAKSLFGENSNIYGADGEPVTRSVKGHSRTRIIGQPPKNIEAFTYEMIQWPVNDRSPAAGGEQIMMYWTGSEGKWSARVSGSLWKLGTFLQNFSPKSVWFHTMGGNGYGPFQKIS